MGKVFAKAISQLLRIGGILCQTASVFLKLSGPVGVKSALLKRLERILPFTVSITDLYTVIQ